MNLLLLSVGTRNKTVQFFKETLLTEGKVICTDLSKYAPALYEADDFYIVPPINNAEYIDIILDICEKENITGVLSFIDPELELLAEHKKKFDDINVTVVLSPLDVIKTSFNKYEFYKTLIEKGFSTQKTYLNIDEVITALNEKTLNFPVFVKPNEGSASTGIQKVFNLDTLKVLYENAQTELITQEYIDGKEYGIDVYVDTISKEVISIFIKEKLKMRAGETDKAISVKNEKMTHLIKSFIEEMRYIGPIDIDLFEKDGIYYISEVNPRFGGGYPHAYLSRCNFPKFIIENLKGNNNLPVIGQYDVGTVMMKFNEIKLIMERTSIDKILLSSPHMGGTEIDYIQDAFTKNWIAPLGENVDKFEEAVKDHTGTKNAVALSSGTAALHLALIESGVIEGDTVFCSSLTFSASANPIIYEKAIPVFIDSEMDTWNMSPLALEKAFQKYEKLNQLPKAVIVVNLYGQSAKMNEILEICKKYNALVIEDAAESLGSTYYGQQSGTLGDFGIYSFNGNKIITTSSGGMLVSPHKEKIDNALFLATQARDKALHYEHSAIGYNYRLSNISAGIGRGQMECLNQRIEKRREVFNKYYDALHHLDGFEFQPVLENFEPNHWLTALTIDKEKNQISVIDLINYLEKNNIETRPVWKPMHLQPIFEKYDYIKEQEDNSKWLFENGICLPSGSNLSEEDQAFVINKIKEFVLG